MKKILLHACCAPCSSAIIEWLQQEQCDFSIFFFNPNIYPEEEYLIRKNEIVKHAAKNNITIYDRDDTSSWECKHEIWREQMKGLEDEPERGARCYECFKHRLTATALFAAAHDFDTITSTLASSRWKDFKQILRAGSEAVANTPNVEFWDKNWRKGGLYERRNILAKQFYNQQYCGCEFSIDHSRYIK